LYAAPLLAAGRDTATLTAMLGNRERAIEGYTLVAEAWRNADPELKTYVDEARAGLARLGGEKRPS
jgi:hypothetical protein